MLFNFGLKVGWSLRFFPASLYLYLIRLSEASDVCYPNVNQDSGAITREKTFVFNLNWRGMEAAKKNVRCQRKHLTVSAKVWKRLLIMESCVRL